MGFECQVNKYKMIKITVLDYLLLINNLYNKFIIPKQCTVCI